MTQLAERLLDYEEHQFLLLVQAIWDTELSPPEHDHLITHFDTLCGHPAGSDLLFYSGTEASGVVNSPANIVATIRRWHQNSGQAAFKGQVLAPPPVLQTLTREQRATQSSSRNLEQARKRLADIRALEQQVTQQFANLEQRIAIDPQADTPAEQLAVNLAALRALESAQHQASRVVRQLEQMGMAVKFALDAAKRDATSPFCDAAIQAVVLQEATAASQLHGAALAMAQARHPALYTRGAALIEGLEARIARLAEATDSGPGHGPLTLMASAHMAGLYPVLLMARGLNQQVARRQHHLIKTLRSALAELQWQDAALSGKHPGTCVDLMEFVPATPSADPRYVLSIPLAEMLDSDHLDLAALARSQGEVAMPVRLYGAIRGAGLGAVSGVKLFTRYAHVLMTSTQGGEVPGRVPVRLARWDGSRQAYAFTRDGNAPVTVEWQKGSAAYAGEDDTRPPAVGLLHMPRVPLVEPYAEGARFDDCVVVFPSQSGLTPVYLMFGDYRAYPR